MAAFKRFFGFGGNDKSSDEDGGARVTEVRRANPAGNIGGPPTNHYVYRGAKHTPGAANGIPQLNMQNSRVFQRPDYDRQINNHNLPTATGKKRRDAGDGSEDPIPMAADPNELGLNYGVGAQVIVSTIGQRGMTGTVRWVGCFRDPSKPIVGLEMDEERPEFGSSGLLGNYEIFSTLPRRSWFEDAVNVKLVPSSAGFEKSGTAGAGGSGKATTPTLTNDPLLGMPTFPRVDTIHNANACKGNITKAELPVRNPAIDGARNFVNSNKHCESERNHLMSPVGSQAGHPHVAPQLDTNVGEVHNGRADLPRSMSRGTNARRSYQGQFSSKFTMGNISPQIPYEKDVKVGSSVTVTTVQLGIVRWMGERDGRTMVGLELMDADGSDGCLDGEKLFECLPGRGFITDRAFCHPDVSTSPTTEHPHIDSSGITTTPTKHSLTNILDQGEAGPFTTPTTVTVKRHDSPNSQDPPSPVSLPSPTTASEPESVTPIGSAADVEKFIQSLTTPTDQPHQRNVGKGHSHHQASHIMPISPGVSPPSKDRNPTKRHLGHEEFRPTSPDGASPIDDLSRAKQYVVPGQYSPQPIPCPIGYYSHESEDLYNCGDEPANTNQHATPVSLVVGSRVELNFHPGRFGIIRWIGKKGDQTLAGLEMEEEIAGGGSGELSGKKMFDCPHGHSLFVSLASCKPGPPLGGARPKVAGRYTNNPTCMR